MWRRRQSVRNTVYVGERVNGKAQVYVETSGRMRPLRHIVRHALTGVEWGYNGGGPADLALSTLAHALMDNNWDKRHAWALHQQFKNDVIVSLDPAGFRLPLADVMVWLGEHGWKERE